MIFSVKLMGSIVQNPAITNTFDTFQLKLKNLTKELIGFYKEFQAYHKKTKEEFENFQLLFQEVVFPNTNEHKVIFYPMNIFNKMFQPFSIFFIHSNQLIREEQQKTILNVNKCLNNYLVEHLKPEFQNPQFFFWNRMHRNDT
ncbi:hypothetical protein EDEG_00864 [Edhazardia aedis USNM 41457]|uniref:Uncharacterized protein n=1 Tax=Edhazardia aedis (strain USNM 41457) TaxID=1003232 RepID=J8ZZN0_EDHAE|nr:hypothetical protein EDEG_00864 [Edhazardia aedis USNM 41457]|eukprot:EJW05083.1 hypothetical protein EDEG_00864 [Edhazardia aedis USNM 41457]